MFSLTKWVSQTHWCQQKISYDAKGTRNVQRSWVRMQLTRPEYIVVTADLNRSCLCRWERQKTHCVWQTDCKGEGRYRQCMQTRLTRNLTWHGAQQEERCLKYVIQSSFSRWKTWIFIAILFREVFFSHLPNKKKEA
jgi:hypothetical protein